MIGLLALVLASACTAIALLFTRTERDATTLVSVYVLLLMVVPARFVFPGGGSIVTPALVAGYVLLLWWGLARLHRPVSWIDVGPQPVRYALLTLLAFAMLSATAAHLRPLDEFEVSAIVRTLLRLVACTGPALLVADGVRSVERLRRLVDRIVWFAAIAALYGISQFVLRYDPGELFGSLPVLEAVKSGTDGFARSIFARPAGPTLHPIAFGVLMGSTLPLALHRLYHRPTASQLSRWVPLLLIGSAIPLSLSRSAFLSSVVGFGALWLWWPARRKLETLVLATFGLASTVFVPGLAGTLRSLFTGTSDNPSIQARIDRVPRVFELIGESPLVGRGFGTYTADGYFLLDNELYVSLVEVGWIGVIGYVLITLLICNAAIHASRLTPSEDLADLGRALTGTVLAICASIFTFDAFYYRTTTGLLVLVFGCIGAYWRLVLRDQRPDVPAHVDRTPARPRTRAMSSDGA